MDGMMSAAGGRRRNQPAWRLTTAGALGLPLAALLSGVLCGAPQVQAQCDHDWTDGFGGPGQGLSGGVYSLAVADLGSGPTLYAGGHFISGVARWSGGYWSAVDGGIGNGLGLPYVLVLGALDAGSGPALYAGGWFTSAGGADARSVAKWDGTAWSGLGTGVNDIVWALGAFDDGTGPALYVGGEFHAAGGVGALGIAKWNGTSWSGVGGGVGGYVYAMTAWDDGSGPALFVGGQFGTAGGVPVNGIARWDGASWSALGSGVDYGIVRALQVYDDGSGPALFVGGQFSTAGGVATRSIAKWQGGAWSSVGGGLDPGCGNCTTQVSSLCVYDDGRGAAIYAGGAFLHAGEVSATGIARWNGAAWSALGSGVSGISDLAVMNSGSRSALFAGGFFTVAGGRPSNDIARWAYADATPVITEPPMSQHVAVGDPVIFSVRAGGALPLAYQWRRNGVPLSDGGAIHGAMTETLFISAAESSDAGNYDVMVTNRCGEVTSLVAVLSICAADWNHSGGVDSDDFFGFLAFFFAGHADFNRDGATNSQDFFDFLTAYFVGCP